MKAIYLETEFLNFVQGLKNHILKTIRINIKKQKEKQIEPSHNQRLKSFESFDASLGLSSLSTSITVSG